MVAQTATLERGAVRTVVDMKLEKVPSLIRDCCGAYLIAIRKTARFFLRPMGIYNSLKNQALACMLARDLGELSPKSVDKTGTENRANARFFERALDPVLRSSAQIVATKHWRPIGPGPDAGLYSALDSLV